MQSHENMHLGLDMAVIKHGPGLTWSHFIRSTLTRSDRHFTRNRDAVIALPGGIDEGMVNSVEMYRMRQIVGIFQGHA